MKSHCLEQAIAPATARAYRHDLAAFWRWAAVSKRSPKPRYPVPVAWIMQYVQENLTGFAPSTVKALNAQGPRVTGAPFPS